MVVVLLTRIVAIHAKKIASMVELCYVGWASPTPSHFDEFENLEEPKNISQLCDELYCQKFVGHVSWEE